MGQHKEKLIEFLEMFESNINERQEEQIISEWLDFSFGRFNGGIFAPERKVSAPVSGIEHILVNNAMKDYDLMALREFSQAYNRLVNREGAPLGVRTNYGSSIVMSLFDAELAYMRDEQDTLPTSQPLDNWEDKVKEFLDKGVPDVNKNLCGKCFEMGEYFLELLEPYPKLKRFVSVYHPDFQGPLDICEVLIGSGIFYAFYDESELIKDFLNLITDTYIKLMKKWFELFPQNGKYSVHWGFIHKGSVMLRDDSAMNISPDMFLEFVMPYDSRILREFGGGAVHFCGRADHYIRHMADNYPMLFAVNSSQPHLNDLNILLENTVDKGINILGFDNKIAEEMQSAGRNFNGRLHV